MKLNRICVDSSLKESAFGGYFLTVNADFVYFTPLWFPGPHYAARQSFINEIGGACQARFTSAMHMCVFIYIDIEICTDIYRLCIYVIIVNGVIFAMFSFSQFLRRGQIREIDNRANLSQFRIRGLLKGFGIAGVRPRISSLLNTYNLIRFSFIQTQAAFQLIDGYHSMLFYPYLSRSCVILYKK